MIKPTARKLIAKGVPVGTLITDPNFAAALLNEAFTFVAIATDTALLARAADAALAETNGGALMSFASSRLAPVKPSASVCVS